MNKKNILFVDDDENVISGIQRQLRPYRDQWQLWFARSGPEALKIMENNSIDLIVSDMVMPNMNGEQLLKTVMSQFPSTVRMIFSGYVDENTLKTALDVAHQYLSRPCSAEMLRDAISQVFKIQACVNNSAIVAGVGDIHTLPSLPKIYQELNAAIADENTTAQDIAKIFARDMVLSAKLLQLINSPYFGMNRFVSNLGEAINLIGIKRLNNLVLTAHIKAAFPLKDPNMERYMEYIWLDAARVSELARLISVSENQREDRPDQAYLAGLLHNLGLLIFLSQGGEKLNNLIEQASNTDIPIADLETAIYGFTRSEAATYVLSLWKIPPRILEAILLQNNPNATDYDNVSALTALHVAGCLLKPSTKEINNRLFEMHLDMAYLERLQKTQRIPDWNVLANKVLALHTKK